jgi:hypothetical protein
LGEVSLEIPQADPSSGMGAAARYCAGRVLVSGYLSKKFKGILCLGTLLAAVIYRLE